MVQKKNKSKTTAKKQLKSAAKKSVKPRAKKRATSATKKKSVNPPSKKISRTAARKSPSVFKKRAKAVKQQMKVPPQEIPVQEVTQQSEDMSPTLASNNITPNTAEKNKLLEHQFENRSEVMMNAENQRIKSAMANRQSTKRVFHTQRHS